MSSSIEHKTKRLLVVDDEYFNFEMLKAALASKFDVSYADSGQSCLASAIASPPDIILLDVCMILLDFAMFWSVGTLSVYGLFVWSLDPVCEHPVFLVLAF